MKISIKKQLIAAFFVIPPILLLGTLTAGAQANQPNLSIRIDVAKEVKQFKDNKWIFTFVPVDTARRGDIFRYTITYTNLGQTPATDASIVDPVPKGTVYVLNSADGKDAEIFCSIDGGRFFQPPPATYTVRNPDGTWEAKPAPAEMYTHIKWTIRKPLAPNESGTLSFKVRVQ